MRGGGESPINISKERRRRYRGERMIDQWYIIPEKEEEMESRVEEGEGELN